MSSRIQIRARVLKRGDHWLVITPSGRRLRPLRWTTAMRVANEAVGKERRYAQLKVAPPYHWR